jgi:hypothetical protein
MKLFVSYGHDQHQDFVRRIKRDLSPSHTTLGELLTEQGDRAGALTAFRTALAMDERLAAADPQNAEWQDDLYVSLIRLTQWLPETDDRDAACPLARRLDAQARLLAECFPQDLQRHGDLRRTADLLARACGPVA